MRPVRGKEDHEYLRHILDESLKRPIGRLAEQLGLPAPITLLKAIPDYVRCPARESFAGFAQFASEHAEIIVDRASELTWSAFREVEFK